jgi:hypothetical protein
MPHLGLESLVDPTLLARRVIARSILASSYDRRGGNHDWSSYVRREGKAAVMMEAEGPGCITRIWTADPQKGTVKIFVDGKVVIESKFAELFDKLPLSSGIGGESEANYARSKRESLPMGHTSYCPIPFQRSCKVTIEPEDDYLYYHVNADLYPPDTTVNAFELNSPLVVRAAQVIADWEVGKPLVDMSGASRKEISLASHEENVLLVHEGAGIVRGLAFELAEGLSDKDRDHILNNVFIQAHFDDDEPRDPAINAPLGPLCMDFGQTPRPRSLFSGYDSKLGYYLFFPMPHRNSARIRLINSSMLPVKIRATVLHEAAHEIPMDLHRFRATWRINMPFGPDHRDYDGVACRLLNLDGFNNVQLLHAYGSGHFVGCGFEADMRMSPSDRAAGEGDEIFFIDDDPRLTMNGTGTEDYVNDAWGIRGYVGPLSGDAVSGETYQGPRIFGYRVHGPDPIAFLRSGKFTLEHGTGNNCSGTYRSIAYWYLDPISARVKIEEGRWEDLLTGKRKQNQDDN